MIKTINEIRTSEFGDCDGKKDLYLDAAYTGDRKEAQECWMSFMKHFRSLKSGWIHCR